ncbi:ankyrin repeat domain-containing protein [Aspergillus lucknowensis]|uniref:Ankyrin repeat-containing domain protein n=1 Tax=Aspergillus lucknowensis TaxID=176173 RepID=A0ABR4LHJ0_9EURO
MTLLELPQELLLAIASFLEAERDINSLSRTNTQLHALLNPYLYRQNARTSNSSALLWAAVHGRENTARFSLQCGANIAAFDPRGFTPLMIACQLGHVGVVELLAAQDDVNLNGSISDWFPPDPNVPQHRRPHQYMSPLLFAVESNRVDVVKFLLDHPGVNLHFADCKGWSAVHHATKDGCEAVLNLLLGDDRTRALVDGSLVTFAHDMKRYSAVSVMLGTDGLELDLYPEEADALLNGSLDMGFPHIVKSLLMLASPLTESRCLYEWKSPLASAVVHGDKGAVVSLLPDPTVDASYGDIALGLPPLSLAVCMENAEIVHLLLAADRVDPNIQDDAGRSPLWIAASLGYARIAQLLLEKDGIDVNLKTKGNETPLTIASERGDATLIRLLLAHDNIELDTECDKGWSTLGAAVTHGHHEVAELLLKTEGVDPNRRRGGPPLWTAVRNDDLAMVDLLLATDGVDPNAIGDILGTHALSQAVSQGNADIVHRFLRRDDVDINCIDQLGQTPLDSTEEEGMVEVLRAKGAMRGEELRARQRGSDRRLF